MRRHSFGRIQYQVGPRRRLHRPPDDGRRASLLVTNFGGAFEPGIHIVSPRYRNRDDIADPHIATSISGNGWSRELVRPAYARPWVADLMRAGTSRTECPCFGARIWPKQDGTKKFIGK